MLTITCHTRDRNQFWSPLYSLYVRRNHFILKCKSNYWPRDAFVSYKIKFHSQKTMKHRGLCLFFRCQNEIRYTIWMYMQYAQRFTAHVYTFRWKWMKIILSKCIYQLCSFHNWMDILYTIQYEQRSYTYHIGNLQIRNCFRSFWIQFAGKCFRFHYFFARQNESSFFLFNPLPFLASLSCWLKLLQYRLPISGYMYMYVECGMWISKQLCSTSFNSHESDSCEVS